MYTVNSTAAYIEPALWTKNSAVLTLNDYKFAYGNKMSDADGNPFSIPSAGMAGSASPGASTSSTGAYMDTPQAAPMVAEMSVSSKSKREYLYSYSGRYYNYQPAPVV